MRKATVLSFFGGNQSEVARFLNITRATVNAWPPVVPLEPARALEILTEGHPDGELRVDESLYPRLKWAREVARARRRQHQQRRTN